MMDDLGQGHKSGPWARVKSRHSETALTPSSSLSSPAERPPPRSISSGHLQRAMQITPLYSSLGITQIFCLFKTKALCIPGTVERNNSIRNNICWSRNDLISDFQIPLGSVRTGGRLAGHFNPFTG